MSQGDKKRGNKNMTKAELLRNQRKELEELTNECLDEIVSKLPIVNDEEYCGDGPTLAEIYEMSNGFLSKQSLAYHLNNRRNVVHGRRTEEIFFAKVDSKGRLVKNGRTRTEKVCKTTYARLANIEEVEDDEEDY